MHDVQREIDGVFDVYAGTRGAAKHRRHKARSQSVELLTGILDMTITSIKIANAMVEQLRAELAAAQAVIEQKNEALKVITRRANCLDVLEIARTANEALTLQPCTEVLNKVRADAVAEYVAAATANQHTHQCRRCLNPYTALSENEDCPFCGCTDAEAKAILAAAQDDLAALRLFAANLNATHNATLKEMQITMRQELAAAQKDAERYRWLRENENGVSYCIEYDGNTGSTVWMNMEELDAAIDKEMAK